MKTSASLRLVIEHKRFRGFVHVSSVGSIEAQHLSASSQRSTPHPLDGLTCSFCSPAVQKLPQIRVPGHHERRQYETNTRLLQANSISLKLDHPAC